VGKCFVVLSSPRNQCATFFRPERPDLYVGYRFIEYQPETLDEPLAGIDALPRRRGEEQMPEASEPLTADRADPWRKGWLAAYDESDADDPVQLRFRSFADGSARAAGLDRGGDMEREFFFRPVADGVRMWMRMTARVAVPGACAVQQCLRFSGETAVAWRQAVARVCPLSEFDHQAHGRPDETLTWARREGGWLRFPLAMTRYHTPPGEALLAEGSAGEVAHGLILRESADGSCAAGMYWERTAYLTNRHPADCLHAVVDFGPLEAGESRTVRGRFFLLEGTKDDLLARWREAFTA